MRKEGGEGESEKGSSPYHPFSQPNLHQPEIPSRAEHSTVAKLRRFYTTHTASEGVCPPLPMALRDVQGAHSGTARYNVCRNCMFLYRQTNGFVSRIISIFITFFYLLVEATDKDKGLSRESVYKTVTLVIYYKGDIEESNSRP